MKPRQIIAETIAEYVEYEGRAAWQAQLADTIIDRLEGHDYLICHFKTVEARPVTIVGEDEPSEPVEE